MKIVYSNHDRVPFQIDDADWEIVSKKRWRIDNGYPITDIKSSNTPITLHLFLLGPAPAGLQWDHKDRNKLNNCRENLRAVTPTVQQRNKGLQKNNNTGIKGVQRVQYGSRIKYRVEISDMYLGLSDSFEEAIQVRLNAEKIYWDDER
jgi:hypothetical protein